MSIETLAPKRTFQPGVDVELKLNTENENVILCLSGAALDPLLQAASMTSIDLETTKVGFQKLMIYLGIVTQTAARLKQIDQA
jgi:hypothetical protein